MATKKQAAKKQVRQTVRKTARRARAAGDATGNYSKKEAARTARSVIRYSVKHPYSRDGLAPEFKEPIRQYMGTNSLKATKKSLRVIKRKSR